MKSVALLSAIIAIAAVVFIRRNTNNVCKTFDDYYTNRDTNENCYYNPDYKLSVPEIIKRHGYPVETHYVQTDDGHILSMFRIPHGRTSGDDARRKPILLNHGLGTNSGVFVNTGNKSMAFALVDAGYDLWLGNFRGTKYSQDHSHLDNTGAKYWDFSYHELGVYDVAAQVDFINEITMKKIIYIGYSMGGAAGLVYSSTYPDIAFEKLEISIGLAPAVYLNNLNHSDVMVPISKFITPKLGALTNGKIYPRSLLRPKILFEYLCLPLPIQMNFCQTLDMYMFGHNYEQNDPETLPIIIQHNTDATSVKTSMHLGQVIESGEFKPFDHGEEENRKRYGSAKPASYNLAGLKVPQYFIYSLNDRVITEENIKLLHDVLPEKVKRHGIYAIKDEKFNHLDIVSGKDAPTLVFNPLIKFLNKLDK